MFSSTRLHIFVCIALGIAVSAAPAGSSANINARSPDVYDLDGGLLGLLLGAGAQGGDSDEDTYILKRQLAGLDIGSRLGSNIGLQHAALLGETGLGLANSANSDSTVTKRDVYDLDGGLLGLLFGAEAQGGDSDEDTYILKRQLAGLDLGSRLGMNMGIQHAATLGEGLGLDNAIAERDLYDLSGGIGALFFGGESGGSDEDEYILKREIEARSPDLYDLSGGLGALLFGASSGESGESGESDEDTYILKRQLAGLDIGSRLGMNMGIQHAATLGEGLGLDSAITERDLYDLSGGFGALLFGGENGGSDEDEYILKRQLETLRN